jgi:HK97 family phage prohead protease
MEKEIRSLKTNLRAASDFVLEGRAASYGIRSKNLGGFVEVLAPGAFKQSLQADVRCLFNHDSSRVLGRTKASTLSLSDGPDGLDFRCVLDSSNSAHRDVHAMIKRGDISECSFGFTVDPADEDWSDGATDESGKRCQLRTIRNLTLFEISAVAFPAYGLNNATQVSARALAMAQAPAFTDEELAAINGLSVSDYIARADMRRLVRCRALGRQIQADEDRDRRARAARLGKLIG